LFFFLNLALLYFAAAGEVIFLSQDAPIDELPHNIDHAFGVDMVLLKEVLVLHSGAEIVGEPHNIELFFHSFPRPAHRKPPGIRNTIVQSGMNRDHIDAD
jgi:hypothetical protein